MIGQAKNELKQIFIDEHGESNYQKVIQDKVKLIGEIKESGNIIFGKNNTQFRKDVIQCVLEKHSKDDEETQLLEMVLTEIALDIFEETPNLTIV